MNYPKVIRALGLISVAVIILSHIFLLYSMQPMNSDQVKAHSSLNLVAGLLIALYLYKSPKLSMRQ